MPSYVIFALSAYLILALHGVIDKFLLNKVVRHPIAYTFYSGTTTIFVFLLAPFGLQAVSFNELMIAFAAGGSFLFATYFLYKAIQETSVSRVLPIEGGLVPIFTFIFAHYILGDTLTLSQSFAFGLLTIGSVLMSVKKETGHWRTPALKDAVMAAVLFALSLVLSKYMYDNANLVTGLVWSRLGMFLFALSFLVFPRARAHILQAPSQAGTRNTILFYFVRVLGAVAGLLQNYAIAIGSVVIVNALQGFQFVFLLVITSAMSLYYPKILREKVTPQILALKVFAIFLITLGLTLIAI